MIETAVYGRLSAFAGLVALVGTRVYPNLMPQDTILPACVFTVISAVREAVMGLSTAMTTKRVQVSSYGTNYASAKAVAEQVRAALQYWKSASPTVVHFSQIENDVDLYDNQTREHYVVQDFLIKFTEA